jgi:predicted MFS family arabinose efflux permease
VLLVVTLAGGGLVTFLPIERPSGLLASTTLLAFGAAGALTRWGAGLLADRIGTRVLLPVALIVASLGLCGVAAGLTTGLGDATVLVSAALFGAGFGAVQNLTLILSFARAGEGQSTTASAGWNAAFDTGTAIGALGVGAIAALGPGLPWTYVGCAVLMAVLLPVAAAISRPPVPISRTSSPGAAG